MADASVRNGAEIKGKDAPGPLNDSFFHAVFEGVRDPILVIRPDGQIITANIAIAEALGYSKDELMRMNVADLRPTAERPMVGEHLKKSAAGCTFETLYQRKDNSVFPVEISTRGAILGGGMAYLGVIRDITERKRNEEASRESEARRKSEERLRNIFENASVGILIADVNRNYLACNERLSEIFGYSREELLTSGCGHLLHPDDQARDIAHVERLLRGEASTFTEEFRYIHASGSIVWVRINVSILRGNGGEAPQFIAVIEDITERKRAEKAMEEQMLERQRSEKALFDSEQKLRRANRALGALSTCKEAMIRAEDEATLLNDICHIVVDVGGYRLAWIGYVEDDELRTVRPVARAGYDEGYVDNLRIALNHPVYGSGPTGISLKSGKPHGSRNVGADGIMQPWRSEALKRGYISTLNLPLMYEGQILGTLVIYSDRPGAFDNEEMGLLIDLADNLAFGIRGIRNRIRRDQAEGELRRANEELEARVERRTEELRRAKEQAELYVDLMGHDINNMNQSAMGFLELALETLEAEKRLKLDDKLFVERPLAALESSSRLIDNVRKLQRLMNEGVKTSPVELGEILKQIKVESLGHNGREIAITIPQVEQCTVEANELLQDVFLNLITNAIKHSDEEKPLAIDVKVAPARDNGRMYYRCAVEDNGPGIPDNLKPKLFHRFQRGKTKAHGKGLGLYLIRTLVEGYGGKVWVEDRVEGDHTQGARFVVMLPSVEKD